jgi:nuclear pore complex protein Nup188
LRDQANVDILSKPWQPFAVPSAQEKAKFEAKTAPINVTPASGPGYSLDELKTDTLWLSKLANISEDVALRLVVLEWQNRPTVQLLSGLTEEEALSVNDAAGLANLGASAFIPNSSIVTAPSGLADTQFDSADQRKLRLLQLYLSTRVFILRTSQLLVSWGAAERLRQTHGQDYRVCDDWLEELGKDVAAKQRPAKSEALDQCIQAANERWDAIDNGFTWDVPESIQETTVALWLTSYITEIIHLLHIALIHADLFTEKFVERTTIERWFHFVAEKDFFRNVALVSTVSAEHLSSLTAFIAFGRTATPRAPSSAAHISSLARHPEG